jgi:FkbM family methyltransferase
MGVREGLRIYYRCFGVRGVLAISANRMFGAPREITVHPPGIRSPIRLRLRTSDPGTYSGIILGAEYGFDLPFTPETIVDAGANIGLASIYFANKYPSARIFAIEAEGANFALMARNVEPYPAITPIHAALWNHDGEISVEQPEPDAPEYSFVTREEPGRQGRPVRAVTMRTLMRETGLEKVDLAKIDIEGAERQVFAEPEWLADTRSVMVETHDQWHPGCTTVVDPAMRDFVGTLRGETRLYLRKEDAARAGLTRV